MSLHPISPVRYSGLMPSTAKDFCQARLSIPAYWENERIVTSFSGFEKNFIDLAPHEASRFLRRFGDYVRADCKERAMTPVRGPGRDATGEPVTLLIPSPVAELGGQRHIFAEELLQDGDGESNSQWVAESQGDDKSGLVLVKNYDMGQSIRCEVDAKTGCGRLTLTDADLSLSYFVTPDHVRQGGLAFYASPESLARFIGLPKNEAQGKNKPVAQWMQQALEKLTQGTFPDTEFSPVDWSRDSESADVQGRQGVIISGAVLTSGTKQRALRMSLVASGATQVFDDEKGNRRVEASKENLPKIFIEILNPDLLGFSASLIIPKNVQEWVEQIWSGK